MRTLRLTLAHAADEWQVAAASEVSRLGRTDEYGFYAAEDKVHFHDLHATILHLLGLNLDRLAYRYAGRGFRLTDIHDRIAKEIIH